MIQKHLTLYISSDGQHNDLPENFDFKLNHFGQDTLHKFSSIKDPNENSHIYTLDEFQNPKLFIFEKETQVSFSLFYTIIKFSDGIMK